MLCLEVHSAHSRASSLYTKGRGSSCRWPYGSSNASSCITEASAEQCRPAQHTYGSDVSKFHRLVERVTVSIQEFGCVSMFSLAGDCTFYLYTTMGHMNLLKMAGLGHHSLRMCDAFCH